jgi:hypothetical protein
LSCGCGISQEEIDAEYRKLRAQRAILAVEEHPCAAPNRKGKHTLTIETDDSVYCNACGAGYPDDKEIDMTEAATTTPKKKKTPPHKLAAKQLDKQAALIREADLEKELKDQMSDFYAGCAIGLQNAPSQISDTDNPPPADSFWGQAIALGRKARTFDSVLTGAEDNAGEDAF